MITTQPTPNCYCSARHTSLECPSHGEMMKRCLARDEAWRAMEWLDQVVASLRSQAIARRSQRPVKLLQIEDEAKDVPESVWIAPRVTQEVEPLQEIIPGSGITIPGANIVQPPNADAPMISFVRPFQESEGTRAMIKAFKSANPVIQIRKPEDSMSGPSINLKPIPKIIDLEN